MTWYDALVAVVAVERLAELVVARRNERRALARGGVEHGRAHYPPMVALHGALLIACVVETHRLGRPVVPWLAALALMVALASQGLRWWCIGTLGPQWNTRVIVIPGLTLVTRGPYRWLRHPNYLAVVAEGAALPLVHTAWITATVFTLLDAILLLGFRIPAEERALDALAARPRRAD